MTLAIAIVALVLAVLAVSFLAAGWAATAARLARAERRIDALEHEVRDRLLPDVERSVRRSEAAADAAREARLAVGIEDPPPLLAGERVTGPLVRAVAFGAGARRTAQRLAANLTPGGSRARRTGRSGRNG